MRLLIVFLIAFCLLVSLASARECDLRIEPNTNCTMVTPVIYCSSYSYDLENLTDGSILLDDSALTSLVNGKYYLMFNQPSGSYGITLCDNTTRSIIVDIFTNENIYNSDRANFTTILEEVDSAEETLASLQIQINSNTSSILDRISLNASDVMVNISAEHSLTRSQLSSNASTIMLNVSAEHALTRAEVDDLEENITQIIDNPVWGLKAIATYISGIASDVWSYASRLLTDYNQTSTLSYLGEINETLYEVPLNTWGYASRNLTNYNQSLVYQYLDEINESIYSSNISASDIWDHVLSSGSTANNLLTTINTSVWWLERLI